MNTAVLLLSTNGEGVSEEEKEEEEEEAGSSHGKLAKPLITSMLERERGIEQGKPSLSSHRTERLCSFDSRLCAPSCKQHEETTVRV